MFFSQFATFLQRQNLKIEKTNERSIQETSPVPSDSTLCFSHNKEI
jgi:hypothetical protein